MAAFHAAFKFFSAPRAHMILIFKIFGAKRLASKCKDRNQPAKS